MQVFLSKENIGKLTKTGNTIVQLSPSVITLGSKQYSSGNLSCDLSVSGVGGIDSGFVAGTNLYYIYIVLDTTSKLIISTSNKKPLGFALFKKVGALFTTPSGEIRDHYNINDQDPNEVKSFMTINGGGGSPEIDTVGGTNIFETPVTKTSPGRYTIDYIPDYFSERPGASVSTRGGRFAGVSSQGTIGGVDIAIDSTGGSPTDDDFTVFINPHGNDIVPRIDWTDY